MQEGDHLPCHAGSARVLEPKIPELWPDYKEELEASVIPCAQIGQLPASVLDTFFNNPYTLTRQTDRMGARLKGPALEPLGERLISEGTSQAIQVPADGQPIVLLNDRQTIGGYPKLGAVTPRSLDFGHEHLVAQRSGPGRLRCTRRRSRRQFLSFTATGSRR